MEGPSDFKSLLRDLARFIQERVHERLVAAGYTDLRPAHANVLQYLGLDGQLRVQELAARAQVAWPSMAELVAQLEAAGYVRREPDPRDKRAKMVVLTERGRALVPIAVEAMREIEDEWAQALGEHELAHLRTNLQRLWSQRS